MSMSSDYVRYGRAWQEPETWYVHSSIVEVASCQEGPGEKGADDTWRYLPNGALNSYNTIGESTLYNTSVDLNYSRDCLHEPYVMSLVNVEGGLI